MHKAVCVHMKLRKPGCNLTGRKVGGGGGGWGGQDKFIIFGGKKKNKGRETEREAGQGERERGGERGRGRERGLLPQQEKAVTEK